jgi:ubiquitin-protein ligase
MRNGSLPLGLTNSIFVFFHEQKMEFIKSFIAGSSGTPYAHGLFEFDVCLHNYPLEPPLVNIKTTAGASIRFNPNLYHTGKVCLSLLGTWEGHKEETWSPARTISQVLVSIQSLVMDENIAEKEPF